jgi:hypothetical protein
VERVNLLKCLISVLKRNQTQDYPVEGKISFIPIINNNNENNK